VPGDIELILAKCANGYECDGAGVRVVAVHNGMEKLVSVAAQDLEVCCNVADFLAVACKSRVLVKPALQKLELFS
jgi:hypothetical protein